MVAIAAVLLVGGAGIAWWAQRRATDVAARVLVRAAREVRATPEVPTWPLDAAAATRADARPFPFEPDRPTLVVLLHGMTPNLDLDPEVGTHAYARRYWSHAFVAALFDGTPFARVGTEPETPADWRDVPATDDPAVGLLVPTEGDGRRAVFVVTRDGSLGLGAQVTAAVAQAAAGLERYRAWLADRAGAAEDDLPPELEPQIAWIGHSFGGLVGRYLLTNPPLDGGPFGTDAETRATADELRDRTLYLVTLGTPHEGSAAADRAGLLAAADEILRTEVVTPNAVVRRWVLPLLDQGATLLRLEDLVTEHLRTDVWAALNDPETGLLAAHRTRRGDGSVVPIVALAARSPGGHFFVDPLVSDRIELELAAWYAERLGVPAETYLEYLLQMLLADPTIHALGLPDRGWGSAAAHPAPRAVLDRVTRVPTDPRRIALGPADARVTVHLAARVDYVRGAVRGEIETRGPLGRWWCALVRCREENPVLDTGSVADVDLDGVAAPTVAVVRDLLLGREPPGDAPTVAASAGAVAEGELGDGEIDADGVVPVDSALGYLLGHDDGPALAAGRDWEVGGEALPGGWYRPDLEDPATELPWTYLHHVDLQWEGDVAAWLAAHWLAVAGPDPGADAVSVWRDRNDAAARRTPRDRVVD